MDFKTNRSEQVKKYAESSKNRVVRVFWDMGEVFLRRHIARNAAALSYYLTLSVFPFLICVSSILSSLQIQETELFILLADILPVESLTIITEFLQHIVVNRSALLLVIGLMAMLTTSSAAFRSFTGIMGEIQGEMRFKGIWRGVFSFIFSFAFLIAIYISGLVIVSGEWLLQILERYFDFGNLLAIWERVRFAILFLMLFGTIYGVYIISAPKETKKTQRLPGALTASVVLVAVSAIYSRMISASIKYALVYGSLASFIIIMIWLYTCGIILIMGNVFNISLHNSKKRRRADGAGI